MREEFHMPYNPVVDRDYSEQCVFSSRYVARVLVHHEPEVVPLHWHAGLEANYVVEGTGTVTLGSRVERLHPGKLCIISPYELHSFVTERHEGRAPLILSMSFEENRLQQVYEFADRLMLSPEAPGATDEDRRRMVDLCRMLLEVTEEIGAETSLRINSLLYEVAYLAYRRFVVGPRKSLVTRTGRNMTQAMFGYIEEHHTQAIGVQDVADHFGYSREYFSRIFKTNAGVGFKEYLTGLRLEDAYCRIMFQDYSSLSEIARDSGFPSARSLVVAFERRYGEHPKEYRRSHPVVNAGMDTSL